MGRVYFKGLLIVAMRLFVMKSVEIPNRQIVSSLEIRIDSETFLCIVDGPIGVALPAAEDCQIIQRFCVVRHKL